MHFDEFDVFTRRLCLETEKIILEYFENPDLEIITKTDDSPVTAADKHSERIIREAIGITYPDHGIFGEEYGEMNPEARYKWIIDPIDGTKTFTAGCPLFGTMIALVEDDEPLFGCVNYPALHKRLAGDGNSAWVNGERVQARTGIPLKQAVILTSDYETIPKYQNGKNWDTLIERSRYGRTWGDCYGYLLLATGKAEAMVDPIMNPWDLMALIPIIRGAGATITDWQGDNPAKGESIIAANSDLHEEIKSILNA
ncbi:MAG: inositol monophosphatase family protein [Verrucomicrobiota bacterium]